MIKSDGGKAQGRGGLVKKGDGYGDGGGEGCREKGTGMVMIKGAKGRVRGWW